jgi:hypothetical protein
MEIGFYKSALSVAAMINNTMANLVHKKREKTCENNFLSE